MSHLSCNIRKLSSVLSSILILYVSALVVSAAYNIDIYIAIVELTFTYLGVILLFILTEALAVFLVTAFIDYLTELTLIKNPVSLKTEIIVISLAKILVLVEWLINADSILAKINGIGAGVI